MVEHFLVHGEPNAVVGAGRQQGLEVVAQLPVRLWVVENEQRGA